MTWEMSIVVKHSYAWRCRRRKTLTRCPNDVIGRISADFLSRPLFPLRFAGLAYSQRLSLRERLA
jgi:hypothetical protein